MVLLVLLLGILNFFWGEKVPAGGGFGWDGIIYADMVRNLDSFIDGGKLSSYYAQKMLPSVIVRSTFSLFSVPTSDLNIIRGFEIYNMILIVFTCLVWKRLANFLNLS